MPYPFVARIGAGLRRSAGLRALLDARLRVKGLPEQRRLARRDRHWLDEWAHRRDLRLNVGSSGGHVSGWISIDLERDPDGRCFQMDASQPWPFRDESAIAVNSEHFI